MQVSLCILLVFCARIRVCNVQKQEQQRDEQGHDEGNDSQPVAMQE